MLDWLEAAFSKRRAELLASDAGRWALFVQPTNRCQQPELVGCYDTNSEACEIGYQSQTGRRFLVKAILDPSYPRMSKHKPAATPLHAFISSSSQIQRALRRVLLPLFQPAAAAELMGAVMGKVPEVRQVYLAAAGCRYS